MASKTPSQTVDKKLFSPEGGRIAFSANERIVEFLDFAIQAEVAYVNKLASLLEGRLKSSPPVADSDDEKRRRLARRSRDGRSYAFGSFRTTTA